MGRKRTAASKGTTYPGVYWYETKGGRLFRCSWVSSNGETEWAYGFASALDAHKHRSAMVAAADAGQRIATRQAFEVMFPAWLKSKRSITEGTRDGYEDHFIKRLRPAFGELPLRKLNTFEVIDDAVSEWDECGDWAPKTINNTLGALSSFLSDMVRQGKAAQNMARYVERVPEEELERDWLRESKGEIDAYLDACQDFYRPIAEFLIETGVRISEALAVKLPDLDLLDECVVQIMRTRRDRAVTRTGGRRGRRGRAAREGDTKGKVFRTVAIGPEYAERLAQRAAMVAELADDPREAYLFQMPPRPRGDRGGTQTFVPNSPIDRNTVSRNWHKETLADAGLRDMPLHALRHTAAALWLRDHDMEFVRRQLGHAQITTTQKMYGHIERSLLAERAAKTERRRRASRREIAELGGSAITKS